MKQKLNVTGMHCHSCEMLIEDTLSDLNGVKSAKAVQKYNLVTIEFDEKKVKLETIKKEIEQLNFKVK
jgi:copper chaperone CopZ